VGTPKPQPLPLSQPLSTKRSKINILKKKLVRTEMVRTERNCIVDYKHGVCPCVSHNVPKFGIATQTGSGRLKHQFPTAFPNLRVGALKQQFPAVSPDLRGGRHEKFFI
jgi:hypothetical protein